MNAGFSPKQYARIGRFLLEEAILDVLLEAQQRNECLGPTAISKKIGIFRAQDDHRSYIAYNILQKLEDEGRVERSPSVRGGWQLTQEEFVNRHDDL